MLMLLKELFSGRKTAIAFTKPYMIHKKWWEIQIVP